MTEFELFTKQLNAASPLSKVGIAHSLVKTYLRDKSKDKQSKEEYIKFLMDILAIDKETVESIFTHFLNNPSLLK